MAFSTVSSKAAACADGKAEKAEKAEKAGKVKASK